MAKKEVKTDLQVARQLDDSKIKYDAQGSDVKEINDALQSASKRGTGNAGYPEYVAIVKDFVIVIEDKADLAKHQKLTSTGILSVDQKDIADYAVNGAYFYAKHIAQNSSFHKIFAIGVSGDEKHHRINPNNPDDKQVKSQKELHDLFPFHTIPAERVLGEDDTHNSSLGSLISGFFDMSEADLDPKVAEEIKMLRTIVEKANKDVQKQSDEILSSVVNSYIGFGYPNIEELKLGVTTQLSIDDQIKNQTKLSYISGTANESLPSSHNGLGYKNLIKLEFLLAAFARDVEKRGVACVPLLFIEEPESHMHPQMQTAFATYLEKFLGKLSNVQIQTFLTSHSAHIANTMEFAKVRYAQKSNAGVIYKNLNTFAQANSDNVNFIRKYLTLTKCDLFFADKAIFVEGASERLLLPGMIEKCEATRVFGFGKYPLSAQYYTLIEIGGAYAHKFIPFIEFLGVPCLILTDLDSVADRISKGGKAVKKSVVVSQGETTSNETIK